MKGVGLVLALHLSLLGAKTINFDHDKVGEVPKGWSVAMTHQGGPPKWEVLAEPTAPSKAKVLAQTSSDATGGRFPLCIYDNSSLTDGEISVAFKPVSGRVDQGAGLVWRYRDPGNYYITRANALENNVVLYKVENGIRRSIGPRGTPSDTYGVRRRIPSGVWSTLRVTFHGPLFTVYLNGDKVFDLEDATFIGPGKVGLWTKADSVIYFDNFEIK
jgi:hypothetical protein